MKTFWLAGALACIAGSVSADTLTFFASENGDGNAVISVSGSVDLSSLTYVLQLPYSSNNAVFQQNNPPSGSSHILNLPESEYDYYFTDQGTASAISTADVYVQVDGNGTEPFFAYQGYVDRQYLYFEAGYTSGTQMDFDMVFDVALADLSLVYGTFFEDSANTFVLTDQQLSMTAGAATVPLPAGLPLLLAGLGGFAALRRRAR